MRIIAGQRRGHKIDGPSGHKVGTRPTSDLVRESLFNILAHAVEDRLVIDLFAGTGALGLEALSRGASRSIFVEQNRLNVALIHRNLTTLRYEDRAIVLPTDVYRWARTFTPVDNEPIVVFIDPPYREYENHPTRLAGLLALLIERLPAGSAIALEASRGLDPDVLPDAASWDVRRYGGTQIAVRVSELSGEGADKEQGPEPAEKSEPSPEDQMSH